MDDDNADGQRIHRRRLREKYGALYDRLLAELYRHDPVGLNFGTNTDEYDPEVRTILPRLREAESAEDVQWIIHDEFVRWFGDTAGPVERYASAAPNVWQAWQRHLARPEPPRVDAEAQIAAEALLDLLFAGRVVDGVDFGQDLLVRFREDSASSRGVVPRNGQVYLNLGPRWALLPTRPDRLPSGAEQWTMPQIGEQLASLHSLWQDPIGDSMLEALYPHLLIALESGRILVLNGQDERTCWHAGIVTDDGIDPWLVAGPGTMLWLSPPPLVGGSPVRID